MQIGVRTLLVTKGTVDVYNAKVVGGSLCPSDGVPHVAVPCVNLVFVVVFVVVVVVVAVVVVAVVGFVVGFVVVVVVVVDVVVVAVAVVVVVFVVVVVVVLVVLVVVPVPVLFLFLPLLCFIGREKPGPGDFIDVPRNITPEFGNMYTVYRIYVLAGYNELTTDLTRYVGRVKESSRNDPKI